jgi:hypothetical protein
MKRKTNTNRGKKKAILKDHERSEHLKKKCKTNKSNKLTKENAANYRLHIRWCEVLVLIGGEKEHENNSGRRLNACRGLRTVCKYGGVRYWF